MRLAAHLRIAWAHGLTAALVLAAGGSPHAAERRSPPAGAGFPAAGRPVAGIVSRAFSTEPRRDAANEAATMITLAGVRPGMRVADVGAGEGYYTIRLAGRVGAAGKVVAEDIDAATVTRLAARARREGLENVAAVLGTPGDPHLAPGTFDRVFLVHMYHEVTAPYELLWHLRAALRPGGKVVVIDADRPTERHGIAPALLACEFAALGFRRTGFVSKPELDGFYAQFEAGGPRPAPGAIRPCAPPAATGAR